MSSGLSFTSAAGNAPDIEWTGLELVSSAVCDGFAGAGAEAVSGPLLEGAFESVSMIRDAVKNC